MLDSNATKVILCYRQHLLQSRPTTTGTTHDLFEPREEQLFQSAATGSVTRTEQCTPIGLASFRDKFNPKLAAQWQQIEEETYECVNMTPVPPFFRAHVPCLGSKTKNNAMPLCVVRGELECVVL